ncbi:class I SAM-dependent methyltransferase [Nocardioides sp.]|uniref:class I SAM-dependent methyltransferase n=1 Tax=Nocardioides sp. TaxID=35761 RepID=UPI0039E4173F
MSSANGTESATAEYGEFYYDGSHLGGDEEYSWDSEPWRAFFRGAANRIKTSLGPHRTLDVGCARGLLVQALAELGVDARGFDISEYAVQTADPQVRDRLQVASATDVIEGRYDLITCVEVVEHMTQADALTAIDNMCAASDRVLLSSTPTDFGEATHVNVRPTADWASYFAERGFFRRTDFDASFLTPWAVLFERADRQPAAVVHQYETLLSPLQLEVFEKRQALVAVDRERNDLRRALGDLQDRDPAPDPREARAREVILSDQALLANHAELVSRDSVVGLEATIVRLEAELAAQRARARTLRRRLREALAETKSLRQSHTWRVGRVVTSPLGKLKR